MYYLVFLHITNEFMIYNSSMLAFVVGMSPVGSVELLAQGADREACIIVRDQLMQSINSIDFNVCAN